MDLLKVFEIEPKQKSVITTIVAIFGLSILQLYIFKRQLFEIDFLKFILIGFGITTCNFLINFPSAAFFFASIRKDDDDNIESLILISGIFMLLWISLVSYISFELNFDIKQHFRLSITIGLIRFIFWLVFSFITLTKRFNKQ